MPRTSPALKGKKNSFPLSLPFGAAPMGCEKSMSQSFSKGAVESRSRYEVGGTWSMRDTGRRCGGDR